MLYFSRAEKVVEISALPKMNGTFCTELVCEVHFRSSVTPRQCPIPSNTSLPKFRVLVYYILLSWSLDHFVYVAMNMEEYCNQGDD